MKTSAPRPQKISANLEPTPNPPAADNSLGITLCGLLAFAICFCLGLYLIPLPQEPSDTYHFQHWIRTNFAYASSPFDLSILSPFQGLGGLVQPIAVWLNPAYLIPHLIPFGEPRLWSYVVVMTLMMVVTYLLGRSNGLPDYLSVIGAQLITFFSFQPFCQWTSDYTHYTGSIFYADLEGVAVPTILGILLLAVFSFLGKLSKRQNILCVILLPVIVVYSILCDPLYTAVMFIPIAAFLGGVFVGSDSRPIFLWRVLGGAVCLIVCLGLHLPTFYKGLTGYAARAVFPNELYVEVQQWDRLTGFFFQGGLTTWAIALMMCGALYAVAFGSSQARGFSLSILFYQWLMIILSVVYVYSGIRWSQPLPVYLEIGAQPAYMVAGLLGLRLLWLRFADAPARKNRGAKTAAAAPRFNWLGYGSVLIIPLIGTLWILHNDTGKRTPVKRSGNIAEATGVMKYLEDQAALGTNGQFRGSVAMVVGVPGGGMLNRFGIPENEPFNKNELVFIESYGTTFAPDLNMTGFWNHRIPTLEDNNHLVTPPFHFLVSRALSRPQDFHSRNWTLITKANPKLMAVLGTKYLITDKLMADPLLTPLSQINNADGVTFFLYEIQHANLANVSPLKTIESTNALETLSLMSSNAIDLNDVAIVDQTPLTGLTRADSSAIYYEKGGVRLRAKSHGPCLLVLPVQFSHSLQIIANDSPAKSIPVKLLRVNLLETGVLFDGEINLKFAHVFGPLRGVRGRLQDIEDCRRLGIKETGDIPYPPDYQPLGRKKTPNHSL